jgi:hypothetical protein
VAITRTFGRAAFGIVVFAMACAGVTAASADTSQAALDALAAADQATRATAAAGIDVIQFVTYRTHW